MPQNITEAVTVTEATAVDNKPGHFLIGLIDPGQGSSGFYPADVLEAAATDRVFPAGTHMYLDHPTVSDKFERPERSVRDLAAVLAEDARWDGSKLVAEAAVFGPYRELLTEMSMHIGVSIAASAEVEEGADIGGGRRGRLIKRIVEAKSVDFVTKAGRGGEILQVLESARDDISEARNIGQWVESRIHRDFTITADDMAGEGRLTRDERIGLSSAIGDALQAFVTRLEADHPQLYARDLWDEPQDTIATALEAAKTSRSDPAGQPHPIKESEEDTMATTIEEAQSELAEAAGREKKLKADLSEAQSKLEKAEVEVEESRAAVRESKIATIIAEADAEFDDLQVAGLKASAPIKEGVLDESAFKTVVDEAAARIAEANGAGRPRGNGQRTNTTDTEVSEADLDAVDSAIFGETKEA